MSEVNRTPGNWHLGASKDYIFSDATPYQQPVASVECGWRDHKDHMAANAKIIAVAPDMLKVVEHIDAIADDPYLMGHPEWVELVKEARNVLIQFDKF